MFNEAVYYNILKPVAALLLLVAVSIYIPFPGFFCSFFIPLPILYYRVKTGREIAGIISLMAIIGAALISEVSSFNTCYVVGLIIIGFVLGEMLSLNYSIESAVFMACASALIIELFFLFFHASRLDKGIIDFTSEYIIKNMNIAAHLLYDTMGANNNTISSAMDKIGSIMIRTLPGITVSASLIIAWISVLISKKLFEKNKIKIAPLLQSLNRWHTPDNLIWGVIVCAMFLFIRNDIFKILGANGLIILFTAYFFQGIAIISFYLEKKNFPVLFKTILYCLIFLQNFLLVIVIGLGLFDIWINFRKINFGEK